MNSKKEFKRAEEAIRKALKEAEQRHKAAASKNQLKKSLTANTSSVI